VKIVATDGVNTGEDVSDYTFTIAGHDVAITNVLPSKTVVGQGYSLNINVTVANQGDYTETFNVITYYNLTSYTEPPGLVGYWKFDEGSGTTAYDSSGYNNHGTLYNNPTWVEGKMGNALDLDGVDDYVSLGTSDVLAPNTGLTISAWIKPDTTSEYGDILCKGFYGPDYDYTFVVADDVYTALRFQGDGYPWVQGPNGLVGSISLGSWQYVALTYDRTSGYAYVYINGERYLVPFDNPVTGDFILSSWNAFIGCNWVSQNYFNGTIDEVRIYNRALSQAEIIATMHYGTIGTQAVTLSSGTSTTLTFPWNTTGFAKGNYTISAYAWPVPGETDTTDNPFISPSIIHVVLPGDANLNGRIEILDVVLVTTRYGSKKGDSNYDPNVDWNGDGKIDILDVVIVTSRYGFIDP